MSIASLIAALVLLTAGHVTVTTCAVDCTGGPTPTTPAYRFCADGDGYRSCRVVLGPTAGPRAVAWELAGTNAYIHDLSTECPLVRWYPNLAGQDRKWDGNECYAAMVVDRGMKP